MQTPVDTVKTPDHSEGTGLPGNIATTKNLKQTLPESAYESPDSSTLHGGLRTKGYEKKNNEARPLVTIVTVVLNAADSIEETIRSVLFQDYDNLEYIVVDGGSVDGTIDIIKSYESYIDYWISAPDSGIYNAMNKGVSLAKGEYLNFLNADDHFMHARVIQMIVDVFKRTGSQCVIGDALMLSKKGGEGYIRHCDVNRYYFLFKGIPQQVFFYSNELFKSRQFDETMRIAADLDFYLSCMSDRNIKITTLKWPIVVFNTGATSSNTGLLGRERQQIINRHFTRMERFLLNNRIISRFLVTNNLRRRRPNLIDRFLRKLGGL